MKLNKLYSVKRHTIIFNLSMGGRGGGDDLGHLGSQWVNLKESQHQQSLAFLGLANLHWIVSPLKIVCLWLLYMYDMVYKCQKCHLRRLYLRAQHFGTLTLMETAYM